MRHRRLRSKLGVRTKHRKALLRNLVRSLVIHQRIRTTVTKAREAGAFADKMVQMAKRGDLHSRRTLISHLGSPETADALIEKIAPQFKSRQGGYTRVLRIGFRPGDRSEMALLEFTEKFQTDEKKRKAKKKKEETLKAAEVKAPEPKKISKKQAAEELKKDKSAAGKQPPQTGQEQEAGKEKDKKEAEKKGGFLGALRKFLKGDEK